MEEVPKTKYRRLEGGGKGEGGGGEAASRFGWTAGGGGGGVRGISHHHGDGDAGVKEAPYGEEGKKVFWSSSSSRGRVREKEGKRGSSVPDDTSDDEEVEVVDGASSYKVCNMT